MSVVNEDFHVVSKEVDERLVRGIHLRSDILYFKDQAERLVKHFEDAAKAVVDEVKESNDAEVSR